MESSYNARCPAVKRLLREAHELHESTEEYFAQPLDDNLFEWHFTVRGPPETEFDGGIYHGRIIMPPEYPMKPPNIIFFTPNGRFETNKKICLSISGHHPETWQPSWSIRTALLAIIGFMPSAASGTIGALEYSPAERLYLAKKSTEFSCSECGIVHKLLKDRTSNNAEFQREAREASAQMAVTAKNEESNDVTSSIVPVEEEPIDEYVSENETLVSMPIPSTSIETSPLIPTTAPASILTPVPQFPRQTYTLSTVSLAANNLIISAAVFLLIALIIRRLFFLESGIIEDLEDFL